MATFNTKIDEILTNGNISQKQARFCLIDQRTFECRWETIQKIANMGCRSRTKPVDLKADFLAASNGLAYIVST